MPAFIINRGVVKTNGIEDGFNTPRFIMNAGINGTEIYKKLDFSVSIRYQNSYYWQSFLVNGNVPAFFNADGMLRYTFPKLSFNIKVGASNILNHYYYSILGGPEIGGLYYTTLTYFIK